VSVKVYMKKQLNGALTPDDEYATELLRGIKTGSVVHVDISKPRNIQFLRKYFALLGIAFENQERYTDFESFREEVIIASGFYTKHAHLDGTESKHAKSISFARMDDLEFNQLYQRTIDAIITNFLPGTDPNVLASAADIILQFT